MECENCKVLEAQIQELREQIVKRNIEIFSLNNKIFKMSHEKNEILKDVEKIVILKSNRKESEDVK